MMTHYKIEGYNILAGVILSMCILFSVTKVYSTAPLQEDKVMFYIKNDLDHTVLLKLDKSIVTLATGSTKKFHRKPNSKVYLVQTQIMGFRPEKGKEILTVKPSLQGQKILISKITDN